MEFSAAELFHTDCVCNNGRVGRNDHMDRLYEEPRALYRPNCIGARFGCGFLRQRFKIDAFGDLKYILVILIRALRLWVRVTLNACF